MTQFTDLEKFLIQPENCVNETRQFLLPRLGNEYPIELQVISNLDYSSAVKTATKIGKDGKVSYDNQGFERKICIAGMVNPRLTDVKWMEKANEVITKNNALRLKAAEEEYDEALKEWEKEGSDAKNKPVQKKVETIHEIQTPSEMLEFVFKPGEIHDISEAILKISGFGQGVEEIQKEIKN